MSLFESFFFCTHAYVSLLSAVFISKIVEYFQFENYSIFKEILIFHLLSFKHTGGYENLTSSYIFSQNHKLKRLSKYFCLNLEELNSNTTALHNSLSKYVFLH